MPRFLFPDNKEDGQSECFLLSGILCKNEPSPHCEVVGFTRPPPNFAYSAQYQILGYRTDSCSRIATSQICPERNESALKRKYGIIALARFSLIK